MTHVEFIKKNAINKIEKELISEINGHTIYTLFTFMVDGRWFSKPA